MKEGIHSRNVATHLYRYAAFLRSESEKAMALEFLDYEKSSEIERQAVEVQELANYLHDFKEWIVKPEAI
jgi:hypothetical protein